MDADLSVGIKIFFEGMEENGSEGVFEVTHSEGRPGKFLDNLDSFCISDNSGSENRNRA